MEDNTNPVIRARPATQQEISEIPGMNKGMIVMLGQVFFQSGGDYPIPMDMRVSYQCKSDERPYMRVVNVNNKELHKIDVGWLTEASMIGVKNEGGDKLWITNLYTDEPITYLLPEENVILRFTDIKHLKNIALSAWSTNCRVTYVIYPV